MIHTPKKPAMLCLLAAALGGNVSASDGFIVQPKLRNISDADDKAGLSTPRSQAHTKKSEAPSGPGPSPTLVRGEVSTSEHRVLTSAPGPRIDEASALGSGELRLGEPPASEGNTSDLPTEGERAEEPRAGKLPIGEAFRGEQATVLQWLPRDPEKPTSARTQRETPNERAAYPGDPIPVVSPGMHFGSAMPNVVDVKSPAAAPVQPLESEDERRRLRASLVSGSILGTSKPSQPVASIAPIESPYGWQAVGERLSRHLAECESLLKRNAFFSARQEAVEAMLHLVRRLDQGDNRLHSEPAYLAAEQAFKEADDFSLSQRLLSENSLLRRIVNSHETPILKNADLEQLSPLTAAQHYRLYAEQSLCEASQGHPWASEVLYAIGRTYQAEADQAERAAETLRWRAISHYKAAQRILPSNALASNQLGFMMLQMDRPAEARDALIVSINAAPSAAAFQNLIEACGRLGDQETQNWAAQNLTALQSQVGRPAGMPTVTEVDPRVFAAMSPRTGGPLATSSDRGTMVSTASYGATDGFR